MTNSRCLRKALIIGASLAGAAFASSARAQLLDEAPEPKIVATDGIGVNLRSGKLGADLGLLTIGLKDDPDLSYSIFATSGGADNTITKGVEYQDCFTYSGIPGCVYEGHSFVMDTDSDYYMVSPPSSTAPRGFSEQGAMVTFTGLILKDGTVLEFGNGGLTIPTSNPWGLRGFLTKVTKPDGEILNYYYYYGELRSIVSSSGYMLHLEGNKSPFYASNGIDIMQPGRPDKVVLINLAIDYCDPMAVSCSGLTVNWPTMRYAGWDSATVSATDNLGRVRKQVTESTSAHQFKLIWPSGKWLEYALETWQDVRQYSGSPTEYCSPRSYTKWVKTSLGQWSYNFTKTTQCHGGSSVTSGTSTSPMGITNSSDYAGFTDGLGNKTSYTQLYYNNFFGSNPRAVSSITAPEGKKIEYTYDDRLNITKVTITSKDGNSTINAQASFPAECTTATAKYCNRPTYSIDAKGGRTDYTYSPDHGGVLTKTLPAGADGVRPQTRYTYQQLSAKYKNSVGQLVNGSPIWKLVSESTCRTKASCAGTSDEIVTSYSYNGNLLPTGTTIQDGTGAVLSSVSKTYDAVGNVTSVDGPMAGSADTTYYFYDNSRELVGEIDPDPDGSGSLPRPAKRLTYNTDGRLAEEEVGTVTGTTLASLNTMTVTHFTRNTYDTGTGLLLKTEAGQP